MSGVITKAARITPPRGVGVLEAKPAAFAESPAEPATVDTGMLTPGGGIAPGGRTPTGDSGPAASMSITQSVTGFDPDWGTPPETVQGGLLNWNRSRLVYEVRGGAAPPYGSPQRFLYDELNRLESQGIFVQPYVEPRAPDSWRFRWVRVTTDYPEVASPYAIIGDLKDHFVGAALERARFPRTAEPVPAEIEIEGPALPTVLGEEADGVQIEGEALATALGEEAPIEIEGETLATATDDVSEPLLGYHDDSQYTPAPAKLDVRDYVWVDPEQMAPGCFYPLLGPIPVPRTDYESGAWQKVGYVPSKPLPPPHDQVRWPICEESTAKPIVLQTLDQATPSLGSIGFGLPPKYGLTPPPPPVPELPEPEPSQIEIDIPMHSITRELFPKTEIEIKPPVGIEVPELALKELEEPLFGWQPDGQYAPPPKAADFSKFAWIPNRDLPAGCPYPYPYMPVPLTDYESGRWMSPTYVPSIDLPSPYDEIDWKCSVLPGEATGRGKGGEQPEPPKEDLTNQIIPGSILKAWQARQALQDAVLAGVFDEETLRELERDPAVAKLREERTRLEDDIAWLVEGRAAFLAAGNERAAAAVAAKIKSWKSDLAKTTLALDKRERRVAKKFNNKRARELRVQRARLKYEQSTTYNKEKRESIGREIAAVEQTITTKNRINGNLKSADANPKREADLKRAIENRVALALFMSELGLLSPDGEGGDADGEGSDAHEEAEAKEERKTKSLSDLTNAQLKELERMILAARANPTISKEEAVHLMAESERITAEIERRPGLEKDRYGSPTMQAEEPRERGSRPSEEVLRYSDRPSGFLPPYKKGSQVLTRLKMRLVDDGGEGGLEKFKQIVRMAAQLAGLHVEFGKLETTAYGPSVSVSFYSAEFATKDSPFLRKKLEALELGLRWSRESPQQEHVLIYEPKPVLKKVDDDPLLPQPELEPDSNMTPSPSGMIARIDDGDEPWRTAWVVMHEILHQQSYNAEFDRQMVEQLTERARKRKQERLEPLDPTHVELDEFELRAHTRALQLQFNEDGKRGAVTMENVGRAQVGAEVRRDHRDAGTAQGPALKEEFVATIAAAVDNVTSIVADLWR